jgi:hypothetical protein
MLGRNILDERVGKLFAIVARQVQVCAPSWYIPPSALASAVVVAVT